MDFYLQDKRGYVGNDMLFWANGGGYTTDVSKAEVFTQERAFNQHRSRPTDVPWPKDYIDSKTRPAVDHQYVNIDEALKDVGEKLTPPEKRRTRKFNCPHCGKFISCADYHTSCTHCGGDCSP